MRPKFVCVGVAVALVALLAACEGGTGSVETDGGGSGSGGGGGSNGGPSSSSGGGAGTSSGGSSSSGGSGGTCGSVAPCGGTIVGTWKITSACASGAFNPNTSCAGEVAQLTSLNLSGTLTFNANLTYSSSTATVATIQSAVPMSCLPSGAMCSDEDSTVDAGGESVSQTCVASGSNCLCNLSETLAQMTASGTYSTSGTMVTTNPSNGTTSTSGYCVQGNMLYVTSNAMTAGGTSTPAETLVATKQ